MLNICAFNVSQGLLGSRIKRFKSVQKPINVSDIFLSVVCSDCIIVLSKLSEAENIIESSLVAPFSVILILQNNKNNIPQIIQIL